MLCEFWRSFIKKDKVVKEWGNGIQINGMICQMLFWNSWEQGVKRQAGLQHVSARKTKHPLLWRFSLTLLPSVLALLFSAAASYPLLLPFSSFSLSSTFLSIYMSLYRSPSKSPHPCIFPCSYLCLDECATLGPLVDSQIQKYWHVFLLGHKD